MDIQNKQIKDKINKKKNKINKKETKKQLKKEQENEIEQEDEIDQKDEKEQEDEMKQEDEIQKEDEMKQEIKLAQEIENNNATEKQIKKKTFREIGICEELALACERLNYKYPTQIQQESIPYSLQGKDIIALAETGSGKTMAFALPIVQKLLEKPQAFFALVLSPTRELSVQISEQFEALGSSINLNTVVIVGGLDPQSQVRALSKRPHIVIGTPGRLIYHLQNTKGFSLKNIKYLVFDEADKLLNMDFEKEINQILDIINKDRNTFLFSATMTNKVSKLQRASLVDPVKIEVSSKYQTVKTLLQQFCFIPAKDKDSYLTYILNEFSGNSTIIFVNTCVNALRVTLMARNLGFKAVSVHGSMSQVKRLGALSKFKRSENNILIATDVASRGLDIECVDLVINYDIPQHSKEYIHRVGRTARAGRAGRAINLVHQYDVENYLKIEHLLGTKLDPYPVEQDHVMIFKERVDQANRIANQEIKTLEQKDKHKDTKGHKDKDRHKQGQKNKKIKYDNI